MRDTAIFLHAENVPPYFYSLLKERDRGVP
jgi:hypothetical protein